MECDRDRYGSVFYRADQCGFKQEAGRVICRLLDVYEVKWSKVLSASRMFWGFALHGGERVSGRESAKNTLARSSWAVKYYLCQGHFVLFDPTYRNIIGGYSPVVMYL